MKRVKVSTWLAALGASSVIACGGASDASHDDEADTDDQPSEAAPTPSTATPAPVTPSLSPATYKPYKPYRGR